MSWATASVRIEGSNDAVVVTGANLTGWTSLGTVTVQKQFDGYSATEGQYFAALSGDSASSSQIESFLGLSSGKLNSLGNGTPTTGAALKAQVTVHAGDVLHFDWTFKATDYLPFNDFSVAVVGNNNQALELSDVQAVGSYGTSGWHTYSYTATSDAVITVGVATSNVYDSGLSPELMSDNLRVN